MAILVNLQHDDMVLSGEDIVRKARRRGARELLVGMGPVEVCCKEGVLGRLLEALVPLVDPLHPSTAVRIIPR